MIILSNDLLSMGISPECGAFVVFFKYKDLDILKSAPHQPQSVRQATLFPILPYCGHITDGKFTYFGITRQIPPSNEYPPINGDAWHASWQVSRSTKTQATFAYLHDKHTGGFPFNYEATLTYALVQNRLEITLSIRNPGRLPLPCGMGVSMCFARKAEAVLSFTSTHIWHHDNTPIFDRPYETPKEWDFQDGKTITEHFDTCFGGWNGQAIIEYPNEFQVQISALDIFHHLMLNTHSPTGNCFYLAPASNTPDAFNLASQGVINTGIQSIGPGQSLTKTIVLTVDAKN